MTDNSNERNPDDLPIAESAESELSPIVVGYAWVARISTYSVECGVLTWFGWWIDKTFSMSPWGILSGATIGAVTFVCGLLATAKRLEDEEVRERLRQLKIGK